MKKEVYLCSDYLKSHPLYKEFGTDLASLAERDYRNGGYFSGKDIPSIDLDEYERNLKSSNDCTSDGVIGIADISGYGLSNERLLLTELRMGYKNPNNLDFPNLRRKYMHSSEILRESTPDIKIDAEFALIFKKDQVPRAQSKLWNMAKESSKKEASNWKAFDPDGFCNYVNYDKELPLRPTAETVSVITTLCVKDHIGYDEFAVLSDEIEKYWIKIKIRHMLVDMEYMSVSLRTYLSKLDFPMGVEGDLCCLQKRDLEELIRI